MAFDTAGNIIRDAGVELGLLSGGYIDNPFDSTNENILLLVRLLKSVGQELVLEREWSWLYKEHIFSTADDVTTYALPADFRRMVNQTGWNRTTQFPLAGPLSPQEWQYTKGYGTNFSISILFRPWQQLFQINPSGDVPPGETIAYEYISSYWVQPTGEAEATLDAPADQEDTLLFPRLLLVRGLKLSFLRARGFDTTSAEADYQRTLDAESSADSPAAVLALDGADEDIPRIDASNAPDTGYGS